MNVYFILHYHLFFRKVIYFFECLYFSEYNIRMSLYVIWLRKVSSIKYVRNWRGDGGHPQCIQLLTGEGGVMPHVYVRTYTHLFSCFCLMVSCFICRNLTLPKNLCQKGCVRQKRLFFSNEINFCCHEISFFNLKLFLRTKYF